MKFCPEINELCRHSIVKSGRPLYCVYDRILRKFEELKECPAMKADKLASPSSVLTEQADKPE